MDNPTRVSLFLSHLADRYAPHVHLGHRGFRQLLTISRFTQNLEALLGKRTDCAQVEACCSPMLERLCPERPRQGWLPAFYQALTAGLFPHPDYPPPQSPFTCAMGFFLATVEFLLAEEAEDPHDHLLDICWASEEELRLSPTAGEYRHFRNIWKEDHICALMHLGRQCTPFDPAGHTIGVNNVAMHLARLSRKAGLKVDIPLVCAAALGHDLGKFGCRGSDAPRTARLHYYYTWQYLSGRGLGRIGHTAANHSTWDLEWTNLPMESLLLIYADFRVRGLPSEDGTEVISVCTLEEAYGRILSKLEQVNGEKQRRYATVYTKLLDFQGFLQAHGVSPELWTEELRPPKPMPPALTRGGETFRALGHLAFRHSLKLMETFSSQEAFSRLLEQARGEKNLRDIRTYLLLFEEYHRQMPPESAEQTLSFLYELLMHPEGDVRRRAATLMGRILANPGPVYRKELPGGVPAAVCAPALVEGLPENQALWQAYLLRCLQPEQGISPKHARRITDSLKVIAGSLFSCCNPGECPAFARCIVQLLPQIPKREQEAILGVLGTIPVHGLEDEAVETVVSTVTGWLFSSDVPVQLSLLAYLQTLLTQRPDLNKTLGNALQTSPPGETFAVQYARYRLSGRCGLSLPAPQARQSQLFLENLKSAVHWRVKLAHLEYLGNQAMAYPATAFHTAAHLSNLLSVSEHLPVREYAGQLLLTLLPLMSTEQCNEILVDLTRQLETEQEQVSSYVAPVLGHLLCRMPEKEQQEGMDYLSGLIRTAGGRAVRAAASALSTLGAMLCCTQVELSAQARSGCLALLMTGIAHYDPTIHLTALRVLCRQVLDNPQLPLLRRRDDLLLVGKKLLVVLTQSPDRPLGFYHHAAMLNHLYRLMVECRVVGLSLDAHKAKPVAFFPGTFDPFSLGHKAIVQSICALGYEVYLSIDEFSWSKRTIPKLLRQQIAAMSVSDLWDVYLYPEELPVNLASVLDLRALSGQFPGRQVVLVVGSDVLTGASAYENEEAGSVRDYDHVVFHRTGSPVEENQLRRILRGNFQLLRLPKWCSAISSTRIREAIDKALDISSLVDPMIQSFISARGLYLRSPALKSPAQSGEVGFVPVSQSPFPPPAALTALLNRHRDSAALCLHSRSQSSPLGWVCGHGVGSGELLFALDSPQAAAWVRAHTSGRVFMVDGVAVLEGSAAHVSRLLVGELLAKSLQAEYTWALCRCKADDPLRTALEELGFLPVSGIPELMVVDMGSPLVLIQDVEAVIKPPVCADPPVLETLRRTRQRLRQTLNTIYPGRLLLTFDAGMLEQELSRRVSQANPPAEVSGSQPPTASMCVPYGTLLSDQIVPNTVTKTLHLHKVHTRDLRHFTITAAPGYPSLSSQVRTLRAFGRPVVLVDALLHRGHQIAALDPLFRAVGLDIRLILVGILSGQGRDLLLRQGREVDCIYHIPNLGQWFLESSLYPFLGGYSVEGEVAPGGMYPAVNPVLPYAGVPFLPKEENCLRLSVTALENAREILTCLEQQHLAHFSTAMTLARLSGVLVSPRLPDWGRQLRYDLGSCPSECMASDLALLRRITHKEEHHDLSGLP